MILAKVKQLAKGKKKKAKTVNKGAKSQKIENKGPKSQTKKKKRR
jgi:hypothetical protein